MTKSKMNNERDVALWGPSGSGKTWLLNSFGRSLLNITDPEFKYSLTDVTNQRPVSVYTSLENTTGTQRPVDECWLFQRMPREDKIDGRHLLSSHSHIINLHDLKGLETENLTDPLTRMSLLGSDYIILMLDHTLVASPQQVALQANATTGGGLNGTYSQNHYAEIVQRLFLELGNTPNSERFIAICFSKIDLLGVQNRPPWLLIDAYFGAVMTNLLRGYQAQPKWKMEAFCVSAAGYLKGASESKPNYNQSSQSILQPDLWHPHNVEAPFFWLFEEIEKSRLHTYDNGLQKFFFNKRAFIDYPIKSS